MIDLILEGIDRMKNNNQLAMLAVDKERAFIMKTTTEYIKIRYPEIYDKFLIGYQFSGKFFDEREAKYKDVVK